jgi:hypothetical protein
MKTKPLKSILLLIGYLLLLMLAFVVFAAKAKRFDHSSSNEFYDTPSQVYLENFHHIRVEDSINNGAHLEILTTETQPFLSGRSLNQYSVCRVQNDTLIIQLNAFEDYTTITLHSNPVIESLILTNTSIQLESDVFARNRDIYIEASQYEGIGRAYFGLNLQHESYKSMFIKLSSTDMTLTNPWRATSFNSIAFNSENSNIEISENAIKVGSPLHLNCDSNTTIKAPAPLMKDMQLTIRDQKGL